MFRSPRHRSIWQQTVPLVQRFEKLHGNHRSDIAIMGGGITGLSTALELLERGYSVAIYEAGIIGSGTTTASTAHLDAYPEIEITPLVKALGVEPARKYLAMQLEAINVIQKRAGEECDVKRIPAYFYSELESDDSEMRREFESANLAGLPVTWDAKLPVDFAKSGFKIDNMGRVNIGSYIQCLVDQVVAAGGNIFEDSRVAVEMDERPRHFKAGNGTAEFDQVVCCVHFNPTDSTSIDLQIPAYLSYALVAEVTDPFPDVLLWDNADPYFYTRRLNTHDERRIVVGGCDHRVGVGDPAQAIEDLENYVRERYQVISIESPWSAEFFYPTDGLPLIGIAPKKENVWIATGLSGVGLTTGTVAAKLIAEQIAGEISELREALSPARFSLSGLAAVASEPLAVVKDYAERVLPATSIDPSALKPGEGDVGNVDGRFTAVCRDSEGKLHMRSPICTHMGGVVRWNNFEQTWDCPIHGGRFTACGTPVYGPPRDQLPDTDKAEVDPRD